MSHAPHESLPGYSPAQLLVAYCDECEARGARAGVAISHLDHDSFAVAWERAAAWQRDGTAHDISCPEVPVLRALWAVQVQLERRGFPIGIPPNGAPLVTVALMGGVL